jgi:hypothetical protein
MLLMQPQQTGTLVPILRHVIGVMLLCATAVATRIRPSATRLALQRTAVPEPSRL